MESGKFKEYEIAEISDSALNRISQLEKSMCAESNKNIILIAYQSKNGESRDNH